MRKIQKQDRVRPRTPEQLEQKYDLGRDYEEFRVLTASAERAAARAEAAYSSTTELWKQGYSTDEVFNEDTGTQDRAEFRALFVKYFADGVLKTVLSSLGLELKGDSELTIRSDGIVIASEGVRLEIGNGYISGLNMPTEGTQAASKAYVDEEISKLRQLLGG